MTRLLDQIRKHKSADLTDYIPVHFESKLIGWIRPQVADGLVGVSSALWKLENGALRLENKTNFLEMLDESFHLAMDQKIIPKKPDYPNGDDWLTVTPLGSDEPLFEMRRFFVHFIGGRTNGVIINGYDETGLWVAKRGSGVDWGRGMLDVMVGGTICRGDSIAQTVIYEGTQEASLSQALLQQAKPVGVLKTWFINSQGNLINDVVHVHDLVIPSGVTPISSETWEVENFQKFSFDEIASMLENGDTFAPPIHLAMLDFLYRHGKFVADTDAKKELIAMLYRERDFL